MKKDNQSNYPIVRLSKTIFTFLVISLITISFVSAECCEKLKDGGWCQEAPLASCDSNYQAQPTSCEQTSYCQPGTCVDLEEGMCTPNTPRKTCEETGGYWTIEDRSALPQCQYGCCFLGENAIFVTQSKCIILASENNIEPNYRADITDELTCMELSGGSEKGACVLVDIDLNRDCRMTTKSECASLQSSSAYEEVIFYEGYLCSAEFLGVECGPRGGTTCPEDKIGVYFKDTCGNVANIYDNTKLHDPDYWTYIYEIEDSCGCGDTEGNADSPICGNCDYLHGSKCSPYEKGVTSKPFYGDFVCKDLGCIDYKNEEYKHGEKWCETTNVDNSEELLPGTESYLMKCYDGEILKEGCSVGNWRGKICVGGVDEDNKKVATCSANLWHDCLDQETEEACLDFEKRDCKWILDKSMLKYYGLGLAKDKNGNEIEATCIPKYPIALNYEDDSIAALDLANEVVQIPYSFGLLVDRSKYAGDSFENRSSRLKYCGVKNGTFSTKEESPECQASDAHLEFPAWLSVRDEICMSLGDTHLTTNYLGYEGVSTESMFYKFVKQAKKTEEEMENFEG